MKYITFTVPCYNSASYMERCIKSLLIGGKDVEIILIDDGSTDDTGKIADYYEELYPDIVKVKHQKNGGHGAGVNAGLAAAKGIYFKVVDSDDWLDEKAYRLLLQTIKGIAANKEFGNEIPDLFICNYIYDHLEDNIRQTVNYKNIFPEGKICGWNDMGRFHASQYLVMHALLFRTIILRQSQVVLPEHMFYVDNLFSNQPLPFVHTVYYLNCDLYHYYLGREDQSVNEKVLMKRIDQQINVTNLVSRCSDLEEVQKTSPKLSNYLKRNISIMMSISCIHLMLIHNKEANEKKKALWDGIKRDNKALYYHLKYKTICGFTCLPGEAGRNIVLFGYRFAKRIYKFQ